jgi:hypothetical protein
MSACPAEPEANPGVGGRSDSYAPRPSRVVSVPRADIKKFRPTDQ